ncbi:hypothetical protein BDN72DRAFT_842946, partial [Pluteus cervinus]
MALTPKRPDWGTLIHNEYKLPRRLLLINRRCALRRSESCVMTSYTGLKLECCQRIDRVRTVVRCETLRLMVESMKG